MCQLPTKASGMTTVGGGGGRAPISTRKHDIPALQMALQNWFAAYRVPEPDSLVGIQSQTSLQSAYSKHGSLYKDLRMGP